MKRNPTVDNQWRFEQYRNAFLSLNASLHLNHVQQQADLLKTDASKFWKIVNKKRSTGGIPRLVRHEGLTATDTKSSAELFAKFFSSVFVDDDHRHQGVSGPSPETVTNCCIRTADLVKTIQELDSSKGAGHGIPLMAFQISF